MREILLSKDEDGVLVAFMKCSGIQADHEVSVIIEIANALLRYIYPEAIIIYELILLYLLVKRRPRSVRCITKIKKF